MLLDYATIDHSEVNQKANGILFRVTSSPNILQPIHIGAFDSDSDVFLRDYCVREPRFCSWNGEPAGKARPGESSSVVPNV